MVLYGRKIVFLWERKVHFPIIRFGNRREGEREGGGVVFGFGATAKKPFFIWSEIGANGRAFWGRNRFWLRFSLGSSSTSLMKKMKCFWRSDGITTKSNLTFFRTLWLSTGIYMRLWRGFPTVFSKHQHHQHFPRRFYNTGSSPQLRSSPGRKKGPDDTASVPPICL